jgi:CHAT domain-containing protein
VAYAPSALILGRAQQRAALTSKATPTLVGIGDPSAQDPLPGAKAEMSEIKNLFHGATQIRYGRDATKGFFLEALPDATHIHLACHGYARQGYPLETTLHLADKATLTLEEVLVNVSLTVRLVVTAACHSGSFDILHDPDEVLGLPAGLLAVGAGGVVAALWAVDDEATALLMTRFYELLAADGQPASALRHAQLWLRDLTRRDRRAFLKEHADLRRELRRSAHFGARSLVSRRPYRSAEYWAAFALFGC